MDDKLITSGQLKDFAEKVDEKFIDEDKLEQAHIPYLQKAYPIGSVYLSTVATDPATLFGFGTWERIQDRFLLAAGSTYSAGDTGGEATHTLSVDEMPSHNHEASSEETGAHTHKIGTDKDVAYTSGGACWSVHSETSGAAYTNGATSSSGSHSHTITVKSKGNGSAHNNMPPYLTVYIWKRTA